MRTDSAGLDFIKQNEGLRLTIYLDSVGKRTIGVGHLLTAGDIASGRFDNGISEDQAMQILQGDVLIAEKAILDLVKVPLSQNQWNSLVDLVFNLGRPNFASSTLLVKLNQGKYDEVPAEMLRWNKGHVNGALVEIPGLTIRRQKEAELWQSE